jgi:glycerol uptake facilitator-like aquaporin
MVVAEFLGTAALATVVMAMIGRTNFPFFVAAAAGLTVGVFGYLFGSHSNPSVTVGMWTMRRVSTVDAILRVGAQLLGGVAAWRLMEYLLNNKLTSIANADFDWRVLVAEAVGAAVLGLGAAAAVNRVVDNARQAVVNGVALAIGILLASLASNALLNPAVAVGVRSWSWAYAAGPIIGAVVGMSLYDIVYNEATWAKLKTAVTAPALRNQPVAKKTVAKRAPAKKKPAARAKRK